MLPLQIGQNGHLHILLSLIKLFLAFGLHPLHRCIIDLLHSLFLLLLEALDVNLPVENCQSKNSQGQ